MTWFVDASVIVAILGREDDWKEQADRLESDEMRLWSPVSRWESAAGLAPRLKTDVTHAAALVDEFADTNTFTLVAIGGREASAALDALVRFGKGSGHPAKLNMGDCFAYACARANDARLLYKGNDFARTDFA